MALVVKDRVKETSTTTGTGTYTLAGAVTGHQAFSVIGNSNTTFYCATDGTNWEVGVGTYTLSGTTLARTTILASSNSNNAVSWTAGTRTIFCCNPAARAFWNLTTSGLLTTDGAGNITSTAFDALPASAFVASTSVAALRVTQTGSGNSLVVEDSASTDSTPFVVDGSGKVITGYTANLAVQSGQSSLMQIYGVNSDSSLTIGRFAANAGGPIIYMLKSRGAVGDYTAVASSDILGTIRFNGTDGANGVPAAEIRVEVDGTPGTTDMPGRILFLVSPDGSATVAEALRISQNKTLKMSAYGAGALTSDASGNITSVSDARMKDVEGQFTTGLDAILALDPVAYRWNEASKLDRSALNVGFVAQDVEKVIPEAIGVNADGMKSFSDRPVIAALVNSVKELAARVADLEDDT